MPSMFPPPRHYWKAHVWRNTGNRGVYDEFMEPLLGIIRSNDGRNRDSFYLPILYFTEFSELEVETACAEIYGVVT